MTPHAHILLKAPRPGAVKTRLAAAIGAGAAATLYRGLAERTVAAVRAVGWPATIWHAPADAGPEMQAWLGHDLALRAQPAGDLGARMAHALAASPAGTRCVLLGGDCAGLAPEVLVEAGAALARTDVVLGPSLDGGYYLLGGTTPVPDLFTGITWGSNRVADDTRARIVAAGLRWEELPPLRDVDTLEDAHAAGLLP